MAIDPIYATPAGFAAGILGLKLYPWQVRILNELERSGKITVRCCNEAGKTTYLAAPMILWVMACFAGATIVITSGSWRQVKEQLFPAIQRFAPALPGWDIQDTRVVAPNGSRLVGFSTDDAGLFEGFHVGAGGHEETPLLIIVDEAKSVKEGIFEAIDRCRPTWLVLLSSPGPCTGRFYRSHTSERQHYRTHVVKAGDCPHINPQVLADIIARYGADHWFVRSSIHAEFTEDPNSGLIIPLVHVERCVRGVVAWKQGQIAAACDFAAGGDENVLAVRLGNKVRIERAWRETNTMAAAGEFIAMFRALGLKPGQITGDADGLGRPVIDRMRELGWPINELHNNAKPQDPRLYSNRAAELWGTAKEAIERGEVLLPDDPVLIAQLTGRKWKRWSDGTLALESKKDLRARGEQSPDRADALVTVMGDLAQFMTPRAATFDMLLDLQEAREHSAMAGFDAG